MIFVCGDTHMNIDIDKLLPEYWYQGQRLTKDDYLIILGDVGFAWFVEKDEMSEILEDKELVENLMNGLEDFKKGDYTIV